MKVELTVLADVSDVGEAVEKRGADWGSDHELLIAKFRLKLKKVGKILDHSGMT